MIRTLRRRIQQFKLLLVEGVDEHFETALYTPRLHLLYHTGEVLKKYLSLEMQDTPSFERLHGLIKHIYQTTVHRCSSLVVETVAAESLRKERDLRRMKRSETIDSPAGVEK